MIMNSYPVTKNLETTDKKTGITLCFFVLFLSIILFFINLGGPAFLDYDGATYAKVISDTESSGEILTLKWNDGPWFEKPPLYFWLSMGVNKIISDVEFAYRFSSALAGILSILLVMLITFRLRKNYYIVALAGGILLTMGLLLEAGQQVRLDVPVTLAILFTFYSFLKAKENSRWYVGVGIGIALGVLIKSVIGFLGGIFIIIWALTQWDFKWLKNSWLWIGGIFSVLLILPWHIYETIIYGTAFWNSYLFENILSRYNENILGGDSFSNLDYIQYSFLYTVPWLIVFVLAGIKTVYDFIKKKSGLIRDELGMLTIVLFTYGLFFSANTKLLYYILPAIPFMAIFLAFVIYRMYEETENKNKKSTILTVIIILLIMGLINTYNIGYRKYGEPFIVSLVAHDEREIGLALVETSSFSGNWPIYTYNYDYLETLYFYSNRTFQTMNNIEQQNTSFFLILPTPTYDVTEFPPELAERGKILYRGTTATLLGFPTKEFLND